jgi:hypothetical protein
VWHTKEQPHTEMWYVVAIGKNAKAVITNYFLFLKADINKITGFM